MRVILLLREADDDSINHVRCYVSPSHCPARELQSSHARPQALRIEVPEKWLRGSCDRLKRSFLASFNKKFPAAVLAAHQVALEIDDVPIASGAVVGEVVREGTVVRVRRVAGAVSVAAVASPSQLSQPPRPPQQPAPPQLAHHATAAKMYRDAPGHYSSYQPRRLRKA